MAEMLKLVTSHCALVDGRLESCEAVLASSWRLSHCWITPGRLRLSLTGVIHLCERKWMNSKAVSRCVGGKRGHTAHLQSRRRSLQPTSNVHHRREPGTEQRQPASSQTPFFGDYLSCYERQVCLVSLCFSDSDTPHVWLLLIRHQKKYTSHLSFKIRVSIFQTAWLLPWLEGWIHPTSCTYLAEQV